MRSTPSRPRHVSAAASALVFALAASAGGCGAPDNLDDDIVGAGPDQQVTSSLNSTLVKVLGTFNYGQAIGCQSCTFAATTSKYRAYKFAGKAGDQVEAWVRSPNGDAVGWLLNAGFQILQDNDNAGPGVQDSHLTYTLKTDGNYYIAFREHSLQTAQFHVSLANKRPADLDGCSADADCVAVPQTGCCQTGVLVAVNKAQADAYKGGFACDTSTPICKAVPIHDARVPLCDNANSRCAMFAITAIQCGGFIRNVHACPGGYRCQTAINPDLAGRCVPQ